MANQICAVVGSLPKFSKPFNIHICSDSGLNTSLVSKGCQKWPISTELVGKAKPSTSLRYITFDQGEQLTHFDSNLSYAINTVKVGQMRWMS